MPFLFANSCCISSSKVKSTGTYVLLVTSSGVVSFGPSVEYEYVRGKGTVNAWTHVNHTHWLPLQFPIEAHYHPLLHTPMYPLLDLKSLLSFTSGGLGTIAPVRRDTRTFKPSSVYMYLTRHGFLEYVSPTAVTRVTNVHILKHGKVGIKKDVPVFRIHQCNI